MNLRFAMFVGVAALLSLLTLGAARWTFTGGGALATAALVVSGVPALLALALLVNTVWLDGRAARGQARQAAELRRLARNGRATSGSHPRRSRSTGARSRR